MDLVAPVFAGGFGLTQIGRNRGDFKKEMGGECGVGTGGFVWQGKGKEGRIFLHIFGPAVVVRVISRFFMFPFGNSFTFPSLADVLRLGGGVEQGEAWRCRRTSFWLEREA